MDMVDVNKSLESEVTLDNSATYGGATSDQTSDYVGSTEEYQFPMQSEWKSTEAERPSTELVKQFIQNLRSIYKSSWEQVCRREDARRSQETNESG